MEGPENLLEPWPSQSPDLNPIEIFYRCSASYLTELELMSKTAHVQIPLGEQKKKKNFDQFHNSAHIKVNLLREKKHIF